MNVVGDEDEEMPKMVFYGPLDAALINWKADEILEIISCSK